MQARLLVSLSGFDTRALHRCAEFAAELERRQVPLSLLFAPRGGPAAGWVRERARRGDSVLLHGFDHRVPPDHRAVRLGRRAEFAALPAHEARLRLTAATSALDQLGVRAEGFAPPRWIASPGTLEALREKGFRFCVELGTIHDLRTGTLHRARVHALTGQYQRTELVRCFALVLAAARVARRGGLVRLGVDAADLIRPGTRQAVLDAVDVALEHGASGVTYAGITGSPSRPVAAP